MNQEVKSALITIVATFLVEMGSALATSTPVEWTIAGIVGIALAAARAALKVALTHLIK